MRKFLHIGNLVPEFLIIEVKSRVLGFKMTHSRVMLTELNHQLWSRHLLVFLVLLTSFALRFPMSTELE